eukprot:2469026-Amphidinium_carterae.1
MEQGDIEQAYATYHRVMGAHPAPQEEVTGDQLTAVESLLDEGLPPYVDMAVWRPYGLRLQKNWHSILWCSHLRVL